MSSDYSYDEEGHLWPFFVFTLSSLVTVPLTYSLVNRTRDPAASFPRVKTDYRPEHAELIEAKRRREKRKQRTIWPVLIALAGWAIMAYTLYLTYVTPAPSQKIWNPYDILGLSEVCVLSFQLPNSLLPLSFSPPPPPHSLRVNR